MKTGNAGYLCANIENKSLTSVSFEPPSADNLQICGGGSKRKEKKEKNLPGLEGGRGDWRRRRQREEKYK